MEQRESGSLLYIGRLVSPPDTGEFFFYSTPRRQVARVKHSTHSVCVCGGFSEVCLGGGVIEAHSTPDTHVPGRFATSSKAANPMVYTGSYAGPKKKKKKKRNERFAELEKGSYEGVISQRLSMALHNENTKKVKLFPSLSIKSTFPPKNTSRVK